MRQCRSTSPWEILRGETPLPQQQSNATSLWERRPRRD